MKTSDTVLHLVQGLLAATPMPPTELEQSTPASVIAAVAGMVKARAPLLVALEVELAQRPTLDETTRGILRELHALDLRWASTVAYARSLNGKQRKLAGRYR